MVEVFLKPGVLDRDAGCEAVNGCLGGFISAARWHGFDGGEDAGVEGRGLGCCQLGLGGQAATTKKTEGTECDGPKGGSWIT